MDIEISRILKILIRVLNEKPAEILFMDDRAGIKSNHEANLVIWNPFKLFKINKDNIFVENKSMFLLLSMKILGEVTATFLRGKKVYHRKEDGSINF